MIEYPLLSTATSSNELLKQVVNVDQPQLVTMEISDMTMVLIPVPHMPPP